MKVPTGDCNECVCWGDRKVVCTNIDCSRELRPDEVLPDEVLPGCSDEEGKIYKHGNKFVPKGTCDTCTCNAGRPYRCTPCTSIYTCPGTAPCLKQITGSCSDYGSILVDQGWKFVPTSKVESKFVSTSKVKPNEPCQLCTCKDGKHHECKDCMGGLVGLRLGDFAKGELREDCRTCLGLPNTFGA